jgi:hypothetical protein
VNESNREASTHRGRVAIAVVVIAGVFTLLGAWVQRQSSEDVSNSQLDHDSEARLKETRQRTYSDFFQALYSVEVDLQRLVDARVSNDSTKVELTLADLAEDQDALLRSEAVVLFSGSKQAIDKATPIANGAQLMFKRVTEAGTPDGGNEVLIESKDYIDAVDNAFISQVRRDLDLEDASPFPNT